MARAFAAFEGERLAEFHAGGPAEVCGAAVSCGERGIAPEEMTLGAGPDAVEEFDAVALLVEVPVAVTGELAQAAGYSHDSGDAGARVLGGADVGLLVAEAEVLGPVLGSGFDRHAGGAGNLDHSLVETLGVHVDLDDARLTIRSSGGGNGLEERLPEGVATLGDSAFAVDAQCEPGDLRAVLEDGSEGIAAVGGVGLRREANDVVVGVGTVGPLIGVGPDAELEVHAAPRGLGGDELQGFKIALAFAGLERGLNVDLLVAGNFDQVGIGEVEVVAGNAAGEVPANAQRKVEAVEARGGKRVQIGGPEGAVVEPGLVFDLRAESAENAAHLVGGGLDDG